VFAGVVVVSFDIGEIARMYITPIVSGETGYAWLLNEDGIFLAYQHGEFVGQNAFDARAERNPDISYETINRIQQRMLAGEEGVGQYVSGWHREQTGEIEKLIAYTPVHVGNKIWSVAVCAPVSDVGEITRTAYRSELYALGFVILALVMGGIAFFVISHRWSRSLVRKIASQARELSESETRYRGIVQYQIECIDRWLPNGTVTFVNDAYCRYYGKSRDEFIGTDWLGVIAQEDREQMRAYAESLKTRLTPENPIATSQHREVAANGKIRWMEWSDQAIFDEQGDLVEFQSVGRDITERVRVKEKLESSFLQLAETVSRAMESRDPYTAGHQRKVADLAKAVGERMGLDQDRLLGLSIAGLLHDIGKISIPEEILTHPGKLSDEEWAIIRSHPRRGYEILESAKFPWPVADMALHHHERLDGSGYPDGLKDDQLSLEVRILAVCDVVDAMSSDRPYRPARPKEMVVKEILSGKGTKYDPEVVDVLLKMIESGSWI
ncbi:MAG: PAS domain S-box protein, partial [Candidatus Bipolaricaulota bacterium]|nr:PAS domain S-box protein [Candidatus Bipolaricaulota bacterium]